MRTLVLRRRNSGKTTEMVDWMQEEPNRVLVCISQMEATRLARENPEIEGWRFVPFSDVRSGALEGRGDPVLGIDNLDLVLHLLFGHAVQAASLDGKIEFR